MLLIKVTESGLARGCHHEHSNGIRQYGQTTKKGKFSLYSCVLVVVSHGTIRLIIQRAQGRLLCGY